MLYGVAMFATDCAIRTDETDHSSLYGLPLTPRQISPRSRECQPPDAAHSG